MNVILGASGQVGSAIVDQLLMQGQALRAVVRNPQKAKAIQERGIEVTIADAFDLPALTKAFEGASTVFVLTPETGTSHDVIGDTRKILENYKSAIAATGVRKLVGLSSIGAQYAEHSGNLKMSYLLEHTFVDMHVQQIFVRPSYYYSNWLPFLPLVKEQGILPSFYPLDLKIAMSSPMDIAMFVAQTLSDKGSGNAIYEVEGPQWYSVNDVAHIFEKVLDRKVMAQQIPVEKWPETIKEMGFTDDATQNFIEMTHMVSQGKTIPQGKGCIPIKVDTTFEQYLRSHL